jgi:hypothetical protein
MPENLLEAALHYAALGYRLFPCVPGEKRPLTEHGCKDATTDAEQIEQWWTHNPHANIGLATTGLLVLDLDAGNAWLTDDPDKLIELAVATLSLTANGGQHYIFRQPAGRSWRNTAGRIAPHVDTRAAGGYIVVPPSVLTGNKAYCWAGGQTLDEPPEYLPEPPEWLVALLESSAPESSLAAEVTARAFDTPAAVIANTIPAGQRNATLVRLAGSMRRFGMSQEEILAALLRANADRCKPPINHDEVERIAASIARYAPDEVATALAENHWGQMYVDAPEATNDHGDPGPICPPLLTVPGFVAEVMNQTLATAPYPDSALAFAGAMSLQAHLAGRKVRDQADNRASLYVLALANSGVGKDQPRKVNQRILQHVGLADSFADSFASGEGIEDRLFQNPATLFQTDEIDALMIKINQARDSRHEGIVSVLLKMNTSANAVYSIRAKAGAQARTIDQPALSLFGTAIPKNYYEALTMRMLTNGLFARMIVVETPRRGQGQYAVFRDLPAAILDTARWWAEFRPGANGNLNGLHPAPRLVPQSEAATEVFREHRERTDQHYTLAEGRDDQIAMAIWARAHEKARRLALVYACSANHLDPTIDEAAVRWACQFIDHQTRRMLFMAAGHVSENEFDARCKAVIASLTRWREQHGDAWMPFWKISRKHPWTEREHEEVRTALLSQRVIKYEEQKTGGSPQRLYRLL